VAGPPRTTHLRADARVAPIVGPLSRSDEHTTLRHLPGLDGGLYDLSMPRRARHAAVATLTLLLLVGAAGGSSAGASPTRVVTCATATDTQAVADQLRTLNLAEQRQYFADCGFPLTISPHCFSVSLPGVQCHRRRVLVLRSRS
jgi:hypothetical protein